MISEIWRGENDAENKVVLLARNIHMPIKIHGFIPQQIALKILFIHYQIRFCQIHFSDSLKVKYNVDLTSNEKLNNTTVNTILKQQINTITIHNFKTRYCHYKQRKIFEDDKRTIQIT